MALAKVSVSGIAHGGCNHSGVKADYQVAEGRVGACESSLQNIKIYCLVFCKCIIVAKPKIYQDLHITSRPRMIIQALDVSTRCLASSEQ